VLEQLLLVGSLPLLVLGLLLAGLGVPIPEDPLLLAAGVISHRTSLPWWLVLCIVYASAIGADCALFALARRFGERLLTSRPFRRFATPERRRRLEELVSRRGAYAVFIGHHLSVLRPLVFIVAGIEKIPLRKFALWDGLAGLVAIPPVFGVGYVFSLHIAAAQAGVARVEHWVAIGAAVAALAGWMIWSWRRRAQLR